MKRERILMGHGSGGKLMRKLIKETFLKNLDNPFLSPLSDSAVIKMGKEKIAITTDSYVVSPPFFPGGDIGKLAVAGTANDLSVVGATPLFMTLSLVLEEGFPITDLERIIQSIKITAHEAAVDVVTGDTKVVEKGKGDGIFINTSGVGTIPEKISLSMEKIGIGDRIIVNGSIGDHGAAVMMMRSGFQFESDLISDCAPLYSLIQTLLKDNSGASSGIKFMRDPTRGGVAATLNEIAENRGLGVTIYENEIPVRDSVRSLCEILGLDPLYVANEGKVLIIVNRKKSERVLEIMRGHPLGREARIIGEIQEKPEKRVVLKTRYGTSRIVDLPEEEKLPRIC
ncbi:MAG: hydrogenase expression/formation protein HypE [Acidobacteriota bacterium]